MSGTTLEVAIGQLLAVLREACEGPPQQWSYFTDNRPQAGLFGTLAPLDAAQASRPVAGTSIAAHCYHVMWAMAAYCAWIRGEREARDWAESWQVTAVDPPQWERLQQDLQHSYQELSRTVEVHASRDGEAFGKAVAAVAHIAYHLGAIRQKAALLRPA